MTVVEVRPVASRREFETFLTFPWRVYRRDPLWVPPLLSERRKFLDPQRGPFFPRGEAEFYIAWRGRQPVGTICVAEDRVLNLLMQTQDCVFGFFDFLPQDDAFTALVSKAEEVALRRGMNRLQGPFNLDYEDGYGVLLEGRDRPPALLGGHTPRYYREFYERHDFTPARAANIAYAIDIRQETEAFRELDRLAERVRQRGRVALRTPDLNRWDEEVDVVKDLLNAALAHLDKFMPYTRPQVEAMLTPFRKIADMDFILFAEMDGTTIGFFPGLPNLNEVLIHINGLRHPWDYLKAAWYSRRQPKCLSIKSVLVLPEYWGSGAAILMFAEMRKRAVAKGYEWVDLSMTSEDNPKTPMLAERMGGRVYKRIQIYQRPVPG